MSGEQGIVIINCFDTYEHRVNLLMEFFKAQGEHVHVITSDWRHFHKEVRTQYPEGFEAIHVKPYTRNLSADRLLSHHDFAKDVFVRMEQLRPKLLWVLVPPNSLVKCAAEYKNRYPDTKLVLDLIDMWPETMPISRFKSVPPLSLWGRLRNQYLDRADLIVTECELYQTVLQKYSPREKMVTLHLARETNMQKSAPVLPEDKVSLCYLGSINNIIDIPCIAGIVQSIDAPVELHIIGDGEKRQDLIDAASAAGAQVVYHGKVYDPEEKQRIFDGCHFGLNIMKESVFVGLTMKSMDYWEASLPVINNIKGDTWELVDKHGIGVNYSVGQRLPVQMLISLQENRQKVRQVFNAMFTKQAFDRRLESILEQLAE